MIHFPDHHGEVDLEPEDAAPLTWGLDNVELLTVGVDIGTSTSHLLFSRLHLQRLAQSLSSRFVVVERHARYRSPVLLTPYRADGLINASALEAFVSESYRAAGIDPEEVDTGAVILTGVALERANSRAVADLFAGSGGRFVCASAGHNLEAILAAHGSGAVARSRSLPGRHLHVDLGGGTAKLAVIEAGEVLETAAVQVGGRLVVLDGAGAVARVEPAAELAAAAAGVDLRLGDPLPAAGRRRLAAAMAGALVEVLAGRELSPLARELLLTGPPAGAGPGRVTCSGGVSEYLYGRERRPFGDLAPELADAFAAACRAAGIEIEAASGEGIRATVLGASQFTVQLSGNTVHLAADGRLPLRNLPVVRPQLPAGNPSEEVVADALRRAFRRLDLAEAETAVAVALAWSGDPRHASLRALAGGMVRVLGTGAPSSPPLVLALEADVGRSLGAILTEELGVRRQLVCLDGLELAELDFVDVGEVVRPAGVVPVVIKSLAFPAPAPGKAVPG